MNTLVFIVLVTMVIFLLILNPGDSGDPGDTGDTDSDDPGDTGDTDSDDPGDTDDTGDTDEYLEYFAEIIDAAQASTQAGPILDYTPMGYLEFWYNKVKLNPELFLLGKNIFKRGSLSIYINFQYSITRTQNIEQILRMYKTVLNRWIPHELGIDIVLFGIRYDSSIKHLIHDLDEFKDTVNVIETPDGKDNKGEWEGPWGYEYSFYNGPDKNTHKDFIFTGHDLCLCIFGPEDDHFDKVAGNRHYITMDEFSVTQPFNTQTGNEYTFDTLSNMLLSSVHEMGHCLGLDDIYEDLKYPPSLCYEDFPELYSLHPDRYGYNCVQKKHIQSVMRDMYTPVSKFDRISLILGWKLIHGGYPEPLIYYEQIRPGFGYYYF